MTKEKKIYMKEYRTKNRERLSKQRKEYYLKNKEKENLQSKLYKEKNKEELKIKREIYRNSEKGSKKILETERKYRQNNKGKINAKNNKRRASKLQATPKWANLEKIQVLYERATWLKSLTGLTYHVDHIIPLNGKNVCGLHVWANLQILEGSINCSKGNK